MATSTSAAFQMVFFSIPMRSSPTAVLTDTTINITDNFAADYEYSTTLSSVQVSQFGGRFLLSGYSGVLTAQRAYFTYNNTNGHYILFSAEL
jgi:hypothetical protein